MNRLFYFAMMIMAFVSVLFKVSKPNPFDDPFTWVWMLGAIVWGVLFLFSILKK